MWIKSTYLNNEKRLIFISLTTLLFPSIIVDCFQEGRKIFLHILYFVENFASNFFHSLLLFLQQYYLWWLHLCGDVGWSILGGWGKTGRFLLARFFITSPTPTRQLRLLLLVLRLLLLRRVIHDHRSWQISACVQMVVGCRRGRLIIVQTFIVRQKMIVVIWREWGPLLRNRVRWYHWLRIAIFGRLLLNLTQSSICAESFVWFRSLVEMMLGIVGNIVGSIGGRRFWVVRLCCRLWIILVYRLWVVIMVRGSWIVDKVVVQINLSILLNIIIWWQIWLDLILLRMGFIIDRSFCWRICRVLAIDCLKIIAIRNVVFFFLGLILRGWRRKFEARILLIRLSYWVLGFQAQLFFDLILFKLRKGHFSIAYLIFLSVESFVFILISNDLVCLRVCRFVFHVKSFWHILIGTQFIFAHLRGTFRIFIVVQVRCCTDDIGFPNNFRSSMSFQHLLIQLNETWPKMRISHSLSHITCYLLAILKLSKTFLFHDSRHILWGSIVGKSHSLVRLNSLFSVTSKSFKSLVWALHGILARGARQLPLILLFDS